MKKTTHMTGLFVFTLVTSITLGFGASVFAHKGATGVVKQRMEEMKEMKGRLKQIDKMLVGKTAYNDQKLRKSLDYIRDHAGARMTRLFPKGTAHKPSEADPEIWNNWAEFDKMALQLNHSTDDFRARLPDGKADKKTRKSLQASYLALRKSCKICHDRFRE